MPISSELNSDLLVVRTEDQNRPRIPLEFFEVGADIALASIGE